MRVLVARDSNAADAPLGNGCGRNTLVGLKLWSAPTNAPNSLVKLGDRRERGVHPRIRMLIRAHADAEYLPNLALVQALGAPLSTYSDRLLAQISDRKGSSRSRLTNSLGKARVG
jgi:hypothetical protein